MTRPRSELISKENTPYYHCIVRCVRRAFLCGNDPITGKNYDHRKKWTVQRLKQLASIFAIDICAYAVLSNHYHVVLHINEDKSASWSDREVVERWTSIFSGPSSAKGWLSGEVLTSTERDALDGLIPIWRERLTDISWFMRCMNETIARQANKEDNCTGRFWEGRFKSQALLDEVALLACMSYVDLNPVRAKISKDLITSDFTSIQNRLHEFSQKNHNNKINRKDIAVLNQRMRKQKLSIKQKNQIPQSELSESPLMPFSPGVDNHPEASIPFPFDSYLDLVDQTGRVIRDDKKGFIDQQVPELLQTMGLDASRWVTQVKRYGSMFSVVVGNKKSMKIYKEAQELKWVKGASGCV